MKKVICILITIAMVIPYLEPLSVGAKANTLGEVRQDLQTLINKKAAADKEKSKTQSQINTAKQNITNAKNEIDSNNNKIEVAKDRVSSSYDEISAKKEEMRQVVESYQMSDNQNEYMQFIFNANSITDLIYRYSVAEQLMDWQKDEVSKYEDLVSTNEKLQVDLTKREDELTKSIDNLATQIDSLGDKLADFSEISMDVNDEIKSTREYIKFLEDAGCSEDEDIDVCLGAVTDTGFKKPLVAGRITSLFGYRVHPVTGVINAFHNAVDIGGNKEGTAIYASAAGTIGKIIRRASCGGNSVYIWHTVNGKRYTTQYTHLLAIKVEVGDVVTSATIIGTVGGGSTAKKNGGYDTCTTGAHLHFAMATGFYGGSGSSSYTSYSTYLTHCFDAQKFLSLPALGVKWSSR